MSEEAKTPNEAKLEAAIAAVENPQRIALQVALLQNPARLVQINLPTDVSDLELLALMGAVLQIGDTLRAQRPQSRLVVPGQLMRSPS